MLINAGFQLAGPFWSVSVDSLEAIRLPEGSRYIGRHGDKVACLLDSAIHIFGSDSQSEVNYELGGSHLGYISDDFNNRKFSLYKNIILFHAESQKNITLWDYEKNQQQVIPLPEDAQGSLIRLCMNQNNLFCVFQTGEGEEGLYSYDFSKEEWRLLESSDRLLIAAEGDVVAYSKGHELIIKTLFAEYQIANIHSAEASPTYLYMNEGKFIVCYGKHIYVLDPEFPQEQKMVNNPGQKNGVEFLFFKNGKILVKERLGDFHTFNIFE